MSDQLRITRGDTYSFDLALTDENGAVQNITGWTFFLTLKEFKDQSDDDAVLYKEVTSHSDPTQGETTITLDPDDTKNLSGIYYYDIQVKTNANEVITILNNTITIEKDITNRIS